MIKKIITSTSIVFFMLSILVIQVFAQDIDTSGISDDDMNAVAKQLYCPVCENIPLDVCGTQACAQWRELIREKLAQGWNENEIKEYFVLQYGDRVLAEPPRSGLNWLVYILPPVAFLVGVFILYRGIKSWRNLADLDSGESVHEESEIGEYILRIEEELRNTDK